MASTNVTNIKNAFTLSSTLGADPGNQTSKDPTSNTDPNDPTRLISLNPLPLKITEDNYENTVKSPESDINYTTRTSALTLKGEAVLPIFYQTGWYSTVTGSNASYNIKNASVEPGSAPNNETIANVLYAWLDKIFIEFGERMIVDDLNAVTTFNFNFSSQESAIPNSDNEKAGNPPGSPKTPFTPLITNAPGTLSAARFKWIEYFIKEYIKNLKERFQKNNFYKNEDHKKVIEGLSDPNSKLKISVNNNPIWGYTPYSTTKLDFDNQTHANLYKGKNITQFYDIKNIPLYFRDGSANATLFQAGKNSSPDSTTTIPKPISEKASNKSFNQLFDELSQRYTNEQKSNIQFIANINKTERLIKCGESRGGGNGIFADSSKGYNTPIILKNVPNDLIPLLSFKGEAYYIPDRFGDLPFYNSNASSPHELFILSLIIAIHREAFTNSKGEIMPAFDKLNNVKGFKGVSINTLFDQWNHPLMNKALQAVRLLTVLTSDRLKQYSNLAQNIFKYNSDASNRYRNANFPGGDSSSPDIKANNNLIASLITAIQLKDPVSNYWQNLLNSLNAVKVSVKDSSTPISLKDKFIKEGLPDIQSSDKAIFTVPLIDNKYKRESDNSIQIPTYGILGATVYDYKRKCKS